MKKLFAIFLVYCLFCVDQTLAKQDSHIQHKDNLKEIIAGTNEGLALNHPIYANQWSDMKANPLNAKTMSVTRDVLESIKNTSYTKSENVTGATAAAFQNDCVLIQFLEDFGTGTERVSTPFTEYIFNPTSQVNDGQYAIINTSAELNFGWHDNLEDNTPGDVNGRALFVNADFNTDEFYRRTVNGLLMDTDYTFSSFITTLYDTDTNICPGSGIPANVTFRIEDLAGNELAEIDTGNISNESDPNWQEFTIDFNSVSNTSVQIILINNSIGGCGNDLAIDDISLLFNTTPPSIATPADINTCNIPAGVIDLTSQINATLNGLNPADFQITFHNSLSDAEGDVNEIATPSAYTSTTIPETIFIRVERVNPESCFSVVDFDLISSPPTLDLGEDQTICIGGPFTIIPTTTGDITDITYNWSTGETTSSITVNTSDTISLTITTVGGCTVTEEIIINFPEPINASLGDDFITCREFPNTLTASSDSTNVTFEWFLNGDLITGETSNILDFSIPETAVGTQVYSVIITNSVGCTSEDSIDVSLFDVGQCIISQGISPDATPGFNDTLDLEFLSARSGIEVLQIYNRLGTLVFEQNNYVNQWRGQTDDENDLPTGTYFYVINLDNEDPVYGRQDTGWIYLNRND